jgi:hypothetical protein
MPVAFKVIWKRYYITLTNLRDAMAASRRRGNRDASFCFGIGNRRTSAPPPPDPGPQTPAVFIECALGLRPYLLRTLLRCYVSAARQDRGQRLLSVADVEPKIIVNTAASHNHSEMITFDRTGVWPSCLVCETAKGDITMLRKLLFVLVTAAALGTAVLPPSPASAWHGRGHGWGHSGWGHSWGYSGYRSRGHRGW